MSSLHDDDWLMVDQILRSAEAFHNKNAYEGIRMLTKVMMGDPVGAASSLMGFVNSLIQNVSDVDGISIQEAIDTIRKEASQ